MRPRPSQLLMLAMLPLAGLAAAQAPRSEKAAVIGLDGKPDTLPDAAFVDTVRQHCSKCHVVPQPQYVPRQAWRVKIQEMAERSLIGTGLAAGEQSVLWQLDISQFVRYFEARAPETLPLPEPWPEGQGRLKLSRQPMTVAAAAGLPVIANVRLLDLDRDGKLEVVACDMGRGLVMLGEPVKTPGELRVIARVPNPDHATMVDLDKDGKQDLLIADLGDFLPADHEKGSVVWLRQTAPLQFEKTVLVSRIPRTADVQAQDLDGDGDLDLVVAAFGFHTVGGVFVYENQTTDWSRPKFEGYPVDARPGAIHVPIVDIDRDGRPDIVVLLAQQHEQVVAYLNRGPGKGFKPELLFRAVVPVWGSSGIELVDMDKDGDLDLLMTNGDSLDDFTVRPFHGVRWFENQGRYPWKQHDITAMPGVHRAQAADFDGDGDLDIVACAFLPNSEHPAYKLLERQGNIAALTAFGWLEQTAPGVFVPHPLERGTLTHVTLDVGDFDGDGDVDILTANFGGFTFAKTDTGFKADAAVELWVNQLRRP